MTQHSDHVLVHAARIAEAKEREARAAQSQEVRRVVADAFRWLARPIRRMAAKHGAGRGRAA